METRAGVSPLSPPTSTTARVGALARRPLAVALAGGLLAVWLAACGGGTATSAPQNPAMTELPPVAPGDPAADGAPYLAMVAGRLAPEWRHFLDDCRARLPAAHPLNVATLETTAEVVIDGAGAITSLSLSASGNADFDAAAREVMVAISPLPAPPAALLSDDDHLRLSWRFARDARQASAVGARVTRLEEPAPQVVERRLAAGDLGGAARRVARLAEGDPALREQARRVLTAAISLGLRGDAQAQRAAIAAVRRAGLRSLSPDLVGLARATDPALRDEAAAALAQLGEPSAGPTLLELLAVTRSPELAAALSRALVTLGLGLAAEAAVNRLATGDVEAQLSAIAALAELPISPALAAQVAKWSTSREPRLRGALCGAVAHAKVLPSTRWDILGRGMGDRDGSARAACTAALVGAPSRPLPWMRTALGRLMVDRDQRVRAAAIATTLRWEPTRLDDRLKVLAQDADPSVRAAAVPGLARRTDVATLSALASDADAVVRRGALLALMAVDADSARARAAADGDARVRLVAIEGGGSTALLAALAKDESPEVRTEVEVLSVSRRQETLQNGLLRVADADARSSERVRIALAWLLALGA